MDDKTELNSNALEQEDEKSPPIERPNSRPFMIKAAGNTFLDCDSLEPKSPSSIYSSSTLKPNTANIISSVLLSYWNNILGPKIRHLWQRNEVEGVHQDELNFIASHTLSGEICRDPAEPGIDTKLYVMKDRKLVVAAFIFGAMFNKSDFTVHSLSLIIPYDELPYYMAWHELTVSWMTRMIGKFRILLEKEPIEAALDRFSAYLDDYLQMLHSLHLKELAVPNHICVEDTYFGNPIDDNLLKKSIMSHLMTCGRSVVVGRSVTKINMMIKTLALFLSHNERMCSRLVSSDEVLPYHPDLCLQGLTKIKQGQIDDSIKDIVLGKYPTTIIDLTTQDIKQSVPCHEHPLRRHEALKEQVCTLWSGRPREGLYASNSLFITFDDPETLVRNLMEEIDILPERGNLKMLYIEQFMRLMERKALSLIKYVEAETNCGKLPFKHGVKKLMHDLSISLPGDFKMVLATAEKLKPGIYSFVVGDSKQEREQMWQIYDTF